MGASAALAGGPALVLPWKEVVPLLVWWLEVGLSSPKLLQTACSSTWPNECCCAHHVRLILKKLMSKNQSNLKQETQ